MRKITWGALAAAAAVVCTTGVALAGAQGPRYVFISSAYMYAQGALGSARNSADPNQQIECNTRASGSGPSASYWSYCYAYDSANNFASCYSGSDAIASVIRGIHGDSSVLFDWDSSGNCGTVIVYQGSSYEPKR